MPSRPPRPVRRGPAALNRAPVDAARGKARIKHIIYTGAFAAVTIVGAIYGAGLKTQQEYREEKRKVIEFSPEERIRALEDRKAALLSQRVPLEKKLGVVRDRMKKRGETEDVEADSRIPADAAEATARKSQAK